MERYEKYKDSGVEWIGKIPFHWKPGRVKHFTKKITDGSHHSPVSQDTGKRYISVKDVTWNGIDFDGCKSISQEEFDLLERNGCRPIAGDILLTKDGTIGRAVIVGEDNDFVVLSSLGIIRPETSISNSSFLRYYLTSSLNVDQMLSLIQGSALTRITITIIKNLLAVLPPIVEQTAIANYLDKKTSELDTLITKKEKLIELLKEERTAIINQAVTKGLDPNVKMQDSGVEWLGEIPAHWEVKKLKYVTNLKSGENITSDLITAEGEFPVYGGNGLRGYYSKYTNEGNYILIGRQGALCGNINYASDKFWASEHAILCHLHNGHNWLWLGMLLHTMNLNQYSQSAAQPGLAVEKIKNLSIPVPSFTEQNKIVIFVESNNIRIDLLMTKTNQEITLLKEYKTALISEVVTGKVKVI